MKQEISDLLKDKKLDFIESVKKRLTIKAKTEKEVYKRKNATRFISEAKEIGYIEYKDGSGVSAVVTDISSMGQKKFSVTVRDDDSGEVLQTVKIFTDKEDAIKHAKKLAGVK